MGINQIGPVMQIAFVPSDFDAALRHWTQIMGVGPFFVLEDIQLEYSRYLGAPNECLFSIALAYWGDLQVELIRQQNDAPSIYRDVAGQGLHHTCLITDDIAAAQKIAEAAGATLLVEGKVGGDGAVIYLDTGGGPGTIVEVLQPATGMLDLFAMIREASQNWDGSEPLRRLG